MERRHGPFPGLAFGALLLTLLAPRVAEGQSVWSPRGERGDLTFEALRPSLDDADGQDFLFGSLYLGFNRPVSPGVRILGELAISRFGFEGGEGAWGFGNPYLGLEVGDQEGTAFAEVGVRLPLADGEGLAGGAFSDLGRMAAFGEDLLSFSALGRFSSRRESGLFTTIRAGPSVWIDTGDRDADTELFLDYAGLVGYEDERFGVGGGLVGTMLVTEGDLDFGERTAQEGTLRGWLVLDTVRPHVELRVPLDDALNDITKFTLGVGVSVALR